MPHRLHQPGLIVRIHVDWRRTRTKRKTLQILGNHIGQLLPFGVLERIVHVRRAAADEDPVKEAQFEGSVVARPIEAHVRGSVRRHHGLEIWSVAHRHGVLSAAGI